MSAEDRSELDLSRLRGVVGDDTFLYVNYPFCSRLCRFCIYKLHAYSEEGSKQFLSDLEREVSLLGDVLAGFRFRNLHVGGGTPNLVPADALIGRLRPLVDFGSLERFIVETSPRAGFEDYLRALREFHVTKIQLGVQTLDPKILGQEGRDTTREMILTCVDLLARTGIIWSVDLIFGFEGEEALGRDPLRELEMLLEYRPMGVHLYLMRSETTNRFYGEPRGAEQSDRKKSWEVRTFGEAEDRLTERGYQPVYDEYCRGANVTHAQRTLSYDARTGVIPNIVGIGVGAVTHTRIMRYDNVKSAAKYGQLLREARMPHEGGVDYEASGMFPIAMIYFKTRHGAPVSIPTLTESLKLSEFERCQIEGLFEALAREQVPFRFNRGLFSIPERDYARGLRAMASYLEAGSRRPRVEH